MIELEVVHKTQGLLKRVRVQRFDVFRIEKTKPANRLYVKTVLTERMGVISESKPRLVPPNSRVQELELLLEDERRPLWVQTTTMQQGVEMAFVVLRGGTGGPADHHPSLRLTAVSPTLSLYMNSSIFQYILVIVTRVVFEKRIFHYF